MKSITGEITKFTNTSITIKKDTGQIETYKISNKMMHLNVGDYTKLEMDYKKIIKSGTVVNR